MTEGYFWGRKLLKSEVPLNYLENLSLNNLPTVKMKRNSFICLRCGSENLHKEGLIKNELELFYYCRECIFLGRVQSNQMFYSLPQPAPIPQFIKFAWEGELTATQKSVSDVLVKKTFHKENHLVWAVTGSGKTEMLFHTIYQALIRGERIGIASPRVDVCLELYPRLQQIFPEIEIALLYGKQEAEYIYSDLVLCTTHQLLRFYRAFDILIIDEVDAFPFVGNSMLEFGVTQARKIKSSIIYLTATPTASLQKQVERKRLSVSQIPARFHGKALAIPECIWIWKMGMKIRKKILPFRLEKLIEEQFIKKRKTLIFCPTINLLEQLTELLKARYPVKKIESVYASDIERYEKINLMRQDSYDLLLTTTILERGVTFSAIDVIIFQGNHKVFNEAALVQISGRAGRSLLDPFGRVFFLHEGYSRAIKKAITQIKEMNQLAVEKGLLKK